MHIIIPQENVFSLYWVAYEVVLSNRIDFQKKENLELQKTESMMDTTFSFI